MWANRPLAATGLQSHARLELPGAATQEPLRWNRWQEESDHGPHPFLHSQGWRLQLRRRLASPPFRHGAEPSEVPELRAKRLKQPPILSLRKSIWKVKWALQTTSRPWAIVIAAAWVHSRPEEQDITTFHGPGWSFNVPALAGIIPPLPSR